MGTFEIVEHTADVGIRARGATLEETFELATLGLAHIMGIVSPDGGTAKDIVVGSDDLGGLLVDWLSEVLYQHEVNDALLAEVHVDEVREHRAKGRIDLVPRTGEVEGTQVKAITYHQLRVEREDGLWTAQVYVDV